MRRQFAQPFAAGSRSTGIVALAHDSVDKLLGYARRPNEGLARLPRELQKSLAGLVERVDNLKYSNADGQSGFWTKVLELHALAVRELQALYASESVRAERVEEALSHILFLFVRADVFKSGGRLSDDVTLALIRSDTLNCYAQLLESWQDLPARSTEGKLRLMAQFSLIFSSCSQVAVRDDDDDTAEPASNLALYAEYIRALASSQLLEHLSRALLSVEEKVYAAASRGELGPQQAQNLRTGVLDTCGCIVSALHAVAGKGGIMDCVRTSVDPLRSYADVDPQARSLLPEVAAVLSGPCLQFLLGRELVAARLRVAPGQGSAHGLPVAYLPEPSASRPGPGGRTSKRALTDRLLARLGAASMAWQIISVSPSTVWRGRQHVGARQLPPLQQQQQNQPQPQTLQQDADQEPAPQPASSPAAAAAAPREEPAEEAPAVATAGPLHVADATAGGTGATVPYRMENVFDLVFETLSCVCKDAEAEHLPGGSMLTLLEPGLLLISLLVRMRPCHALTRIPGMWRVVVDLLWRRPVVQFNYAKSRPLNLIGQLLVMDPEGVMSGQDQAAGVGPSTAAGALAVAATPVSADVQGVDAVAAVGEQVVVDLTGEGPAAEGEAVVAPVAPDADAAAVAGDAAEGGPRCPLSLRSALDSGFLPALEHLLREWSSDDGLSFLMTGDMESVAAVAFLLRRTGVWPALLTHGSLREGAAMIVTLRRVMDSMKQKMGRVGSEFLELGIGGAYKDAEIAMCAFLGCLLEQCAAVLLPPWRHQEQEQPAAAPSASSSLAAEQPAGAAAAAASSRPGPAPSLLRHWGSGNVDTTAASTFARGPGYEPFQPLALNNAVEADEPPLQLWGMPSPASASAGSCGRLPEGSSSIGGQLQVLTVFALTQWLPRAFWYATLMDTWFSRQLCAAVLRWVVEGSLQCLLASKTWRNRRGQLKPTAATTVAGAPAAEPRTGESEPEAAAAGPSNRASGAGAGSGTGPGASSAVGGPGAAIDAAPLVTCSTVPGGRSISIPARSREEAVTGVLGPIWSAIVEGLRDDLLDQSTDYTSWANFILGSAVDMREWFSVFLMMEERAAEGSKGSAAPRGGEEDIRRIERNPNSDVLVPATLDVMEIMACAAPNTMCMCVTTPAVAAAAKAAPVGTVAAAMKPTAGTSSSCGKHDGAAAPRAPSGQDGRGLGVKAQAKPQQQGLGGKGPAAGKVVGSGKGTAGGGVAKASGGRGAVVVQAQAAAAGDGEEETSRADEAAPVPGLFVLDDWLRGVLRKHGRKELLAVLELWADRAEAEAATSKPQEKVEAAKSDAGGESSSSSSSTSCSPSSPTPSSPQDCTGMHFNTGSSATRGSSICNDTAQTAAEAVALDALLDKVAARHDLEHHQRLPSPWEATEAVGCAGVRLCGNPRCNNIEGPSAADLTSRKVCKRCRVMSYCSGACQLEHWKAVHGEECARMSECRQTIEEAVAVAAAKGAPK